MQIPKTLSIEDMPSHDLQGYKELQAILGVANGLQSIDIDAEDECDSRESFSPGHCIESLSVANSLLMAQSSSALRTVRLACLNLSPSSLVKVLRQWSRNLETLDLVHIYIHAGRPRQAGNKDWLEIFQLLYTSFESLTLLHLIELLDDSRSRRAPDGSLMQGYVQLKNENKAFDSMYLDGRENVLKVLLMNIERGLEETHFIEDKDENNDRSIGPLFE